MSPRKPFGQNHQIPFLGGHDQILLGNLRTEYKLQKDFSVGNSKVFTKNYF